MRITVVGRGNLRGGLADPWARAPFCDGTHATIDFDGTLAN